MFIDFSKAFDTVDHDILLYKLSHYGIRGKPFTWFMIYLKGSSQFVSLNDYFSEPKPVLCGVPQGSILGPLLFIIYINDIEKSSGLLQFILFADDSNIFLSHSDPDQLTQILNNELKSVTNWIKANKLSLNLDKTSYMLFSNKLATLPNDIVFDGTLIQRVRSTKFLGLIIDEKLSWKAHIDNICKIIARNTGILSKLRQFLPKYIMLSLYSTLILPYLNYGLIAWGSAATSQINRLFILQKRAIRIIYNADFRAHTNNLFLNDKTLKIKDLYIFQLGQLMYKLSTKQLPMPLNDMFVKKMIRFIVISLARRAPSICH